LLAGGFQLGLHLAAVLAVFINQDEDPVVRWNPFPVSAQAVRQISKQVLLALKNPDFEVPRSEIPGYDLWHQYVKACFQRGLLDDELDEHGGINQPLV